MSDSVDPLRGAREGAVAGAAFSRSAAMDCTLMRGQDGFMVRDFCWGSPRFDQVSAKLCLFAGARIGICQPERPLKRRSPAKVGTAVPLQPFLERKAAGRDSVELPETCRA